MLTKELEAETGSTTFANVGHFLLHSLGEGCGNELLSCFGVLGGLFFFFYVVVGCACLCVCVFQELFYFVLSV